MAQRPVDGEPVTNVARRGSRLPSVALGLAFWLALMLGGFAVNAHGAGLDCGPVGCPEASTAIVPSTTVRDLDAPQPAGPGTTIRQMAAIPASCDYYLASSGSDGAAGTQAAPLRSVAAALAKVSAGGSICLTGGGWGSQRLLLNKSGSASARIGVYGVGSPVVRGIDVKASNVIVSGFEVTAGGADVGTGIYLEGTNIDVTDNNVHHLAGVAIATAANPLNVAPRASRVRISNNAVSYINGFGIILGGENSTVDHNDVSRIFTIGGDDADGMRVFGSGHTISDNYVHDIYESDSVTTGDPHSDCLQSFNDDPSYLEQPLRNIVVERNVCSTDRHCVIFGNLAGPLGGNIVIRDNVCHSRTGSFGYMIGDNAGQSRQFDNVTVVNNVVSLNGGYFGVYSFNATNLLVANNIFHGLQAGWYGTSTEANRNFVARNNLTTTAPLYADPTNADPRLRYRPRAGSPTIDAGSTPDASSTDILGNARVADGNGDGTSVVDIGPYEFAGGGAAAPTPTAPPSNATPGSMFGSLPANGIGLVVWGGGSIEQLRVAATGKGCSLAAFWVIENAVFIGYVPGAPAIVNQAFTSRFSGTLPSTPGIVVCRSA